MENLAKLILLRSGLNRPLNYSVRLERIFTGIGYFGSIKDLILKLEKENLVKHEGYMDATSGILINIKTTDKGKEYFFNNVRSVKIPYDIDREFRDFLNEFLLKL